MHIYNYFCLHFKQFIFHHIPSHLQCYYQIFWHRGYYLPVKNCAFTTTRLYFTYSIDFRMNRVKEDVMCVKAWDASGHEGTWKSCGRCQARGTTLSLAPCQSLHQRAAELRSGTSRCMTLSSPNLTKQHTRTLTSTVSPVGLQVWARCCGYDTDASVTELVFLHPEASRWSK